MSLSEPEYIGDPDRLDYSLVTSPLLVAAYDRRWQIKVGSIVLGTDRRVQIWTTDAVPLLDCPTRLLIRFGLGEGLSALVDHVICSELAATARAGSRHGRDDQRHGEVPESRPSSGPGGHSVHLGQVV